MEEKLISFCLNERSYLKTLVDPLIETKQFLLDNEPIVFHEEIKHQFKDRLNNLIMEEFCKKFTVSPEEAMILLEGKSLEEYFKC